MNQQDRRSRIAAAQAAARRAERRRSFLVRGGVTVAVLAAAGGLAFLVTSSSHGPAGNPGIPKQPRTTAEGRTTPPPWDAPADPAQAVKAAGLPMLSAEGNTLHIHTHLDVYANGQAVTVPALIGIDEKNQQLSALHTHDATGVIHIESPVKADFSLGQFMTEWQVSLGADHLGGLKTDADHTLTAYVNGKAVNGDPAAILLGSHDEVALVYGTAADNAKVQVPNSYSFPSGL